ncbi:hypothetical protein [Actinomycetospora aeridis]|uniref:Secreted protein n=1 Tax=Actinomycetospora aeridis TaxID=3129231 RepID=A0ABU8N7V8_9PSEU
MDTVPASDARITRLARALPLLLAALLALGAVGTVGSAGCDDPARYVSTPDGIALEGGCLKPAEIDPLVGEPSDHDAWSRRG